MQKILHVNVQYIKNIYITKYRLQRVLIGLVVRL